MSWNDKIVWSEGMFLRPQHFQQHDRYLHRMLEQRAAGLHAFPWGVLSVKVDSTLLTQGKFVLQECRAILPDGTPLSIPDEDGPCPAIEIPEAVKNSTVYLGVPLHRAGSAEVARASDTRSLARWYKPDDPLKVKDSNADADFAEPEPVEIGKLRLRLLLQSGDERAAAKDTAGTSLQHDPRADFSCLGVARIIDRKADGRVMLDEEYIPPALSCQSVRPLDELIRKVLTWLDKRAAVLQTELGEIGRGGAGEFYNFMQLQVVNRYQPLFAHWAELKGLHPLELYQCAIQLAGELATFRTGPRTAETYGPYRHEDLKHSFQPVTRFIKSALTEITPRKAIEIPIQEDKFGYYYAVIHDNNLLRQASFVLAVRAEVPMEQLRREFPEQLTIAAPQEIAKIVEAQKKGVEVTAMPYPPPQIPIHRGNCYFELEPRSSYWKGMAETGGIALHLTGDYPNISMSFWAILG